LVGDRSRVNAFVVDVVDKAREGINTFDTFEYLLLGDVFK
jgi:hypothetical protein